MCAMQRLCECAHRMTAYQSYVYLLGAVRVVPRHAFLGPLRVNRGVLAPSRHKMSTEVPEILYGCYVCVHRSHMYGCYVYTRVLCVCTGRTCTMATTAHRALGVGASWQVRKPYDADSFAA